MATSQATLELIFQVKGNAERELRQLRGQLDDVGDASGNARKPAEGLFSGILKTAGGVLAANVIGGIANQLVDLGAGTISAAGDFEAGMNRFASVTGSSVAQAGLSLDDFEKKFLQLGAETSFSAAQAQDAAIALAKGGVSVADIMNGATDATLSLASAGELDLATAADIVAKQLGVWADRGADAAQVADLLAQAANASTVDVDELALGMANVGGVAKVTGLDLQETVQTMALLAPGFSSASDAGTSFKTFLSRLIPTSDAAISAMEDLGLATENGNSKFFDAQGQFIGMKKAAQLLHDATKDLSEEQRQLAFTTIFGSDAIRAAAMIAEEGGDGFDAMGQAMQGAGTAADQAATKNQGFNFALDSLRGSVETFQIVAGQKLLPILTSIINDGLIPIANVVTDAVGHMGDLGDMVDDLTPVIAGLAGALSVALVPALIAAAGQAAATAAAVAAAVAPYALIAAAIYGVVKAYDDFNDKVTGASTKLLESRQWWQDSTKALEGYATMSEDVKGQLADEAKALEDLRAAQQSELESLGRRAAAGAITEDQYQAELDALNKRADAITQATTALNNEAQAIQTNSQWVDDGLIGLEGMASAEENVATGADAMTSQIALTDEEIQQLVKDLEKIKEAGVTALGELVTTNQKFFDDLAATRETGTDQELRELAAKYAQELAMQRSALGEQLINYINNQIAMGQITEEQGSLMVEAIQRQYGATGDLTTQVFADMTSTIHQFAESGSTDMGAFLGTLNDTELQAGDTKIKMDELAKKYEAELIQNFKDGQIDAEGLRIELSKIPARVYSEIVVDVQRKEQVVQSYVNIKDAQIDGQRADGGPVMAGQRYLVGENGPELFVPRTSGDIVPNGQLGANGTSGPGTIVLQPIINVSEKVDAALVRQAINEAFEDLQRKSWATSYG